MDDGTPERRARAALDSLRSTDEPVPVLDAARRLREAAEEIEQAAAARARWAGTTWHEIGVLYGTTKQGAQQRFGKHLRRRPQPVPDDSAPRG
jgi:predicted CoA-binding protein